MELKGLITFLRRWLWLLTFSGLLGGGGAYVISFYQTPLYEASTKVMIIKANENSIISDLTILNDQELAETYIALLTTKPVLEAASEQLRFTVQADQISAQQLPKTQLVEVIVEDNNPHQAAFIANTLVEALISQNELLQKNRFAASEESLQAQIAQIEAQIASLQSHTTQGDVGNLVTQQEQENVLQEYIFALQDKIASLELEISALSFTPNTGEKETLHTDEQIALLQEKRKQLAQLQVALDFAKQNYFVLLPLSNQQEIISGGTGQSQQESDLALYRQIYTTLLTNYETIRLARLQSVPDVVQVEPASPPVVPIHPRPLLNTFFGSFAGLLIMAGFTFLKEYLDDTLKTPSDITNVLNLPVIGYIASFTKMKNEESLPFIVKHPRSTITEAFRRIRTNLEFANVDKPLKTILITSVGVGEGKTTVAANLAAVMAQGSKKVVLMDCDLHRPRIHRIFGVSNATGLSDFFRGQSDFSQSVCIGKEETLTVITSGYLPPNPAELLGSERMAQFLVQQKETADVIIIDSPPFLVSDAMVLAARVDGVIIVIQPGHTHAEAAEDMVEQLLRAGAPIIGVVLNRLPTRGMAYYGNYHHYYSSYYYSDSEQQDSRVESPNGQIHKDYYSNKATQIFKLMKASFLRNK